LGAKIAAREQAAEFCPAGAISGIGEDVRRAVAKHQARAGVVAKLQIHLALGEMRAHHAGDAIAVADPEPEEISPRGLGDQLLGMRCAPQEGEIRGDGELDVFGHGDSLALSLPVRGGRLLAKRGAGGVRS
jgi:hypothetical protein